MKRSVVFAVVVGLLSSPPALAAPAPSSTVTNLQAAFEAELNAAERFGSFARTADQEGFPVVGRLFRAMARAERVHADNHAGVLASLGARPHAVVAEADVRSTRENLLASIELEKHDRDGRYPWWLGSAREIGDSTPLVTLGIAMFAERAHVLLLEDALRRVELGRDAPAASGELCVSSRSGYLARCPPPSAIACRSPGHAGLERIDAESLSR